jgi:hypothetical protein
VSSVMGSCFGRRREFNASSSIHPIPPNDLCERFAVRVGRQGGEGRAASRPGRHRVRSRGFRFASSLTSDSLRKETALRLTKTYSNRHDAVRCGRTRLLQPEFPARGRGGKRVRCAIDAVLACATVQVDTNPANRVASRAQDYKAYSSSLRPGTLFL